MLDFNNLPTNQKIDKQTFYANSTSNGANWATWAKPRGVNFISIIAIAGGGGGGGGRVGATGVSGGGGGGGSSAYVVALYPAWMLPDVLYVSVGIGGDGGGTGAAGIAGVNTYISIYPSSSYPNNLIHSISSGSGGRLQPAAALGVLLALL